MRNSDWCWNPWQSVHRTPVAYLQVYGTLRDETVDFLSYFYMSNLIQNFFTMMLCKSSATKFCKKHEIWQKIQVRVCMCGKNHEFYQTHDFRILPNFANVPATLRWIQRKKDVIYDVCAFDRSPTWWPSTGPASPPLRGRSAGWRAGWCRGGGSFPWRPSLWRFCQRPSGRTP